LGECTCPNKKGHYKKCEPDQDFHGVWLKLMIKYTWFTSSKQVRFWQIMMIYCRLKIKKAPIYGAS
jgi:hypothetical protein